MNRGFWNMIGLKGKDAEFMEEITKWGAFNRDIDRRERMGYGEGEAPERI